MLRDILYFYLFIYFKKEFVFSSQEIIFFLFKILLVAIQI